MVILWIVKYSGEQCFFSSHPLWNWHRQNMVFNRACFPRSRSL